MQNEDSTLLKNLALGARACRPGASPHSSNFLRRYLSLGNLKDANIVFEETRKRACGKAEAVLVASPLMHYVDFLLQT